MWVILERIWVTSNSTYLFFSVYSTVHRVIGSPIVPEIEGNNESLDGLVGEFGVDIRSGRISVGLAGSRLKDGMIIKWSWGLLRASTAVRDWTYGSSFLTLPWCHFSCKVACVCYDFLMLCGSESAQNMNG